MNLKPMLAGKATDEQIEKLLDKGPMEASPKLDGIRCMIQNGIALSRSLKPIPNKHVQSELGRKEFNGLDGELIVGAPTDSDVYRNTTSHVMSHDKEFKFTFWIFDSFLKKETYKNRRKGINFNLNISFDNLGYRTRETVVLSPDYVTTVRVLNSQVINNMEELKEYEIDCLSIGYEGVILRDPNAMYKHGRSTAKEGGLIKVKRFKDSEATVLDVEEQMKNNNEKKVNELGRGQRSSHKANKSPKGTLGALVVKDVHSGVQFNIGTGFTNTIRDQLWFHREDIIGTTVKYKYFDIGVKEAPRHPVYLGIRIPEDM